MKIGDRARVGGFVSLVGAGTGAADLLTIRAAHRLADADLVLHDGLVTLEVLSLAPAAEHVRVSRRPGAQVVTQDEVTSLMIDAARAGRRVVRLKAGDPFVLGRGGEEALALVEAGVPFDIVPGLTAAVVAPAVAGIPVTHRGVASGFVVVSGHAEDAYAPILDHLPPHVATIVVLMGFAERTRAAAFLLARGWSPDTPAAIVTNASQRGERIWTGTLGVIGEAQHEAVPEDAHTLVIGDVVAVGTVIAAAASAPFESRSSDGNERGSQDVRARAAVVCA
jgi:uroporphyrin-III C-methyltransferase / precorrin-2 dehydrogenase / sirohydrochlorin ferrochelatase